MGMYRIIKPESDTGTNTWTIIGGAATNAAAVNKKIGTYTVRGSGLGTATDLCDDTIRLRTLSSDVKATFVFGLLTGDDDIANVTFYIRVSTTAVQPIVLFERIAGVDYDIGTVTASNTNFTDLTHTESANALGEALALGNPQYGFRIDALNGQLAVSRFYAKYAFTVGSTLGKDRRGENWRFCDQCGRKFPYSLIQQVEPPHPQAGLAVCATCLDEPDHDTRKILSNNWPVDDDNNTLY